MTISRISRLFFYMAAVGLVGAVQASSTNVSNVSPEYANLIVKAKEGMANSYSPYSNFKVGCALLTKSGKIYQGCNVENASYGAAICAERVALTKAVSEGSQDIVAIAVVSSGRDYTFPCGICRQFACEFGLDIDVILTNDIETKVFKLNDLLVKAFTPKALEDAKLVNASDSR